MPVRSTTQKSVLIYRLSGISSQTSHGHRTGTRSMRLVRPLPLVVCISNRNLTLYTPNSSGGGKLFSFYYIYSVLMY